MDFSSLQTQLIFGFGLAVLSYALTRLMIARVRIMDDPNERSSHEVPTPRSGGIAIVAAFFVGLAALYAWGGVDALAQDYFWVFAGAAGLIAAVSILDDVLELSFKAKLGTQVVCAALVMGFGIVIERLNLPGIGVVELGVWGYPLTLLWIVGLTNAFNFMDGIDGIAGGTAVVAAGFFALITFTQGSTFIYAVSALIAWVSLGFLVPNWQPARIFMGDAGSQFLGFVLAVLAVMAATFDAAHTSFLVMPLLFAHYIWDTAYTFFRRARRGERVTQAHRTHLYQLMNQLGLSHAQVTSIYLALGTAQGLAALALVHMAEPRPACVIAPFVAIQVVLTVVVTRRARRQGLIA